MQSVGQESDRDNSEVARQTDHSNQQEPIYVPEDRQRRLENKEALFILFTVGLMPSYMMPTPLRLVSQDCLGRWLGSFVGLIVLSGICNYVTLKILSKVADTKQMESYQEVAYNISNSNRGYIFLISSAKFIFMAVTVSLNIDYCASYIASLFQLMADHKTASQSYGIYVAGVTITAILLAIPYWMMRAKAVQQDRSKLRVPSYVFFVCFWLMFVVNLALLLAAVFHSSEMSKENWLYQQVLRNKSIPYDETATGDNDKHQCSSNQTVIGYVPALFYSNMFSLVFLQIKAKTKISQMKAEKDFIIGAGVVLMIFATAFVFYGVFLIGTLVTDNDSEVKRTLILGVFNAIETMPQAFVKRDGMTIFDMGYALTFMMMLAQAVVMLQFAREHLLIFVDEHVNQGLSKQLDWKNKGVDTNKKGKGRRGERSGNDRDQGGNGPRNPAGNVEAQSDAS